MSSQDSLNRAIEATFAALNQLDGAALQGVCTPAGLAAVTALMGETKNQFARFPVSLVLHGRAAVRGMQAGDDIAPIPLWLGFEHDDEWRCTGTLPSREAAQSWLATTGSDDADDPANAVVALCDALTARDHAALRAMTAPRFRESSMSPQKWAVSLPADTPITLAEATRLHGNRAAAQLLIHGDAQATQWFALERSGEDWKVLAAVDERAARAWLGGLLHDIIPFSELPGLEAADAFMAQAVGAVGEDEAPPAGADAAAWAILTEAAPAGLNAVPGPSRYLAAAGRVAVQLRFVDFTDPDWTDDERWAVLAQAGPTAPWQLVHTGASPGMNTLLHGLPLPWPSATDDPSVATGGPNDALRDQVAGLFETLRATQTDGEGPQPIDASVLTGLFGSFAQALKSQVQDKKANSNDDVVDLAAERARRERGSTPTDPTDVGKALQDALSEFVGRADGGTGEVKVDAEFLKSRAPEIASTLFGALAKALVPETVSVNVPTDVLKDDLDSEGTAEAEPDKDGKRTVKVDLDLSSLFGKLFEKRPTPEDE